MSRATRFLNACLGHAVDTTPVWFMRQAGRYMAEYRALRERYSILEMIRSPELATDVTLQPVEAFDIDAAIIFADILPLLDAMGMGLDFVAGEGPQLQHPVRKAADVDQLRKPDILHDLDGTIQAVSMTRKALENRVPLIGFSGAPFTLACYAIQGRGGHRFQQATQFLTEHPAAWHRLMEKLSEAVLAYLLAQRDAGAQALQLFDSWAGLLTPEQYREAVHPYSHQILSSLDHPAVPLIHFGTGSRRILSSLAAAGGNVLGVDPSLTMTEARALTQDRCPLQGNLSPELLAEGNMDAVYRATDQCLDEMKDGPGHIFNLGHGILKHTDPERVRALTQYVHERGSTP